MPDAAEVERVSAGDPSFAGVRFKHFRSASEKKRSLCDRWVSKSNNKKDDYKNKNKLKACMMFAVHKICILKGVRLDSTLLSLK